MVGGRGRPAAPVVTVPGETILPTVVGEVEGGGGGRRVPGEYNVQKQPTLMCHWINKIVRGATTFLAPSNLEVPHLGSPCLPYLKTESESDGIGLLNE